jgi:hypothetical protein
MAGGYCPWTLEEEELLLSLDTLQQTWWPFSGLANVAGDRTHHEHPGNPTRNQCETI